MWNIIVYFCCFLSGLFFGVFILTVIENNSKGFRNFVRGITGRIPFYFRTILMAVIMIICAVCGYLYLNMGNAGGILMGAFSGIFMYFRAGVTMGNDHDPYNKGRKRQQKHIKDRKKAKAQKKARKMG